MADSQYTEAPHEDRFTAPGVLELLQCFANTIDVETARDDLAPGGDRTAPSGLRHWLLEHELIGLRDRVNQDDLKTGLDLRGAIRELAHTNHGEPASPEPLKVLERIGAAADLEPRFRPGEPPILEPQAKGVSGALGKLVAIAFGSMSQGDWQRLKICRSDDCAVVFYDYSKNQSKSWCSMRVCGNRTKVRNYRRREKAGTA
ncbi:MAG: CGNR zinc finger domain-containing protein [Actinomycetota bacterium]